MKVSQVFVVIAIILFSASIFAAEEWKHIQKLIRDREIPCRGVNLGGWLVLEQYMTEGASFWEDIDEDKKNNGEYYLMTQTKDYEKTHAAVAKHHAEFITEDDIEEIATAGMNTVRIPIGWWIRGVDDADMFVNDTLKYLDLLIKKWAVKHDLAVLVDIHAARGGQNAMEMSAPFAEGMAQWDSDPLNIQNTIDLAVFIANRYTKEEAFLGIGLLNEPTADTDEEKLYQYYQDAYRAVREVDENCILVVAPQLHKQNPSAMVGFMEEPEFKYVWVDWHPYFKWGYENAQDSHVLGAVKSQNGKVDDWNNRENHNTLMSGEWSLAVRDGQFEGNEEGYYDFAQEQVTAYNKMEGGWTYWSWKVFGDENYDAWSMRSVLRDERFSSILLSDAKVQRAERDEKRPPPSLPPTTAKPTPKPTKKVPVPSAQQKELDASLPNESNGSHKIFSILSLAFSLIILLNM